MRSLSKEMEDIRTKLHRGQYSSIYEAVCLRCLLFDYDIRIHEQFRRIKRKSTIAAILEAISGAAMIFHEYGEMAQDDAAKEKYGRLATFGVIQGATHLIEACEALSKIFGLPTGRMKEIRNTPQSKKAEKKNGEKKVKYEKDFWDFRNNLTHVHRNSVNQYGFDVHEIPPMGTRFGSVLYRSFTDGKIGHSIQTFVVARELPSLFIDVQQVFDDCLGALDASAQAGVD